MTYKTTGGVPSDHLVSHKVYFQQRRMADPPVYGEVGASPDNRLEVSMYHHQYLEVFAYLVYSGGYEEELQNGAAWLTAWNVAARCGQEPFRPLFEKHLAR
jgi:hypothetical protein